MASTIIHWLSYAMFLYLFGKASLLKIFLNPTMMEGMASLGFGKAWTLTIGYLELLGILGLVAGLFSHEAKNAAVIFLFPFSVGALMVHFAHNDYKDFYDALLCTILSLVLLVTDKYFKVIL